MAEQVAPFAVLKRQYKFRKHFPLKQTCKIINTKNILSCNVEISKLSVHLTCSPPKQ